MFASKLIKKGEFICNVPGLYFEKPTAMDNHRDYVWENVMNKNSFDSTCFRNSIVSPSGFGQFVNTSHPFSPKTSYSHPNCEFVVSSDGCINVICKKNLFVLVKN